MFGFHSVRGLKTSCMSGALINQLGGRKHDPVQLTPTLINYYNDKLIGHAVGWINDALERQVKSPSSHKLLLYVLFRKLKLHLSM